MLTTGVVVGCDVIARGECACVGVRCGVYHGVFGRWCCSGCYVVNVTNNNSTHKNVNINTDINNTNNDRTTNAGEINNNNNNNNNINDNNRQQP